MSAARSRRATSCRKRRSRWRASDAPARLAVCSREAAATHEDAACCAPSSSGQSSAARRVGPPTTARTAGASTEGMVALPRGRFLMGTDDPVRYAADGEGPVREVSLRPYWIDAMAVSNGQFAAFVDATGFVTDAEREGWSFVFAGLL